MPFVDFSDMPWKPEVKAPRDIPANIRDMILDHGSLTERLKNLHNNVFFVKVINHHWAMPTESEQQFLNGTSNGASSRSRRASRASIREVLLYGSGAPVVFARSVLPESSLSGGNQALLELGSKPLGEYIFSQPDLRRGPIEIAPVPARQFNEYLDFDYLDDVAWGRRSLFLLNSQPISVCEVFLPVIEAASAHALN